ncbi:hypothetical protein McpSp1_12440 [Methanocorpusculaceae archaeon Sp1]|nr:hypothetical protein [Methanocorpusculaceae archaeon Sp1]
MENYTSIKPRVLAILEHELPYLREKYGIQTIGIFGSVSREEDTPDSDIDILYTIRSDKVDYDAFIELNEYLKDCLGRNIDMISLQCMRPQFRKNVEPEMILFHTESSFA